MGYDRGRSHEALFRDEERGGSGRGQDHNSSNTQNGTDSTWRPLWCHSHTVNLLGDNVLDLNSAPAKHVLSAGWCGIFFFFLPAWYAKRLFCQQHLSLTGPLQPINVEKDKPRSRPHACFFLKESSTVTNTQPLAIIWHPLPGLHFICPANTWPLGLAGQISITSALLLRDPVTCWRRQNAWNQPDVMSLWACFGLKKTRKIRRKVLPVAVVVKFVVTGKCNEHPKSCS